MADLDLSVYETRLIYSKEPAQTRCTCSSCTWVGIATDLNSIEDCTLTAGDTSPAGRCPSCDALAYVRPHPDEDTVARARWDAICVQQGWSDAAQATHLLAFVLSRGLMERLAAYAHAAANAENAAT